MCTSSLVFLVANLFLIDYSTIKKQSKLTSKFRLLLKQNSFVPVARLAWLQPELLQASNDEVETTTASQDGITVFYYHNDHLGTPNELVDDKGNVVLLADYQAWGERGNSEALLRPSARRKAMLE